MFIRQPGELHTKHLSVRSQTFSRCDSVGMSFVCKRNCTDSFRFRIEVINRRLATCIFFILFAAVVSVGGKVESIEVIALCIMFLRVS